MSQLVITDHALLRWMERRHGVDVEAWRALMQEELAASLDAFEGHRPDKASAFVLCGQSVVTVLAPGYRLSRRFRDSSVAVPCAGAMASSGVV